MQNKKVISLEDRVPKLKRSRRRKANRTLVALLLLFFSLICLIVYFQSPYSHIGKISTVGNKYYSKEEIIEQSNLSSDDNIWNLKKKDVIKRIEELQQLKKAEIQLSFPNEVVLKVTEFEIIAHLMIDNNFYPVLENGTVFEEANTDSLLNNGLLLFEFDNDKVLKNMINEVKLLPDEIFNAVSEIHYDPTEMDSNHLLVFMNDGHEVQATINSFSEKMAHYPSIVSQLDKDKKGIIDLEVGSFFIEYESEKERDVDKDDQEG